MIQNIHAEEQGYEMIFLADGDNPIQYIHYMQRMQNYVNQHPDEFQ